MPRFQVLFFKLEAFHKLPGLVGLLLSDFSQLPFVLLLKLSCLIMDGVLVSRLSLGHHIFMISIPLLELLHHLLLHLLLQTSHLLLVPLGSLGYLLIHQQLMLGDGQEVG